MPSAFTAFDPAKPAATQSGTTFAASANANDVALWYMVAMGGNAVGFAASISGGTTEEPLYYLWTNGAQIVRATNTWASGYITQQVWEVSQDTGGSYAAVATQTFTYDGTTGALTATTNAGGMLNFLYYLIGRVKELATTVAADAAAIASLGTMSTQAASAVNITGGHAVLDYERETAVAIGNVAGSTAVNWQAGGLQTLTVTNSAAALTWSNLPGSGRVGYLTLEVTNGAIASALLPTTLKAGGVALSWTNPGLDIITLECHDSATVRVVGFAKDVK